MCLLLYKQPQYSGQGLNLFRFDYQTDYKHFQADEQQVDQNN